MSFYEPQGWQAPARQTSWEQPPPPSRSGASSSSQREDGNAFATQFEEVDRAVDNLLKSGKFYQSGPRRDSVPVMMGPGRPYHEQGHRTHGSRHSVSDFDPTRTFPAANLQNFYASQRYQGHPGHPGHQGRHSDADPTFQAKKRIAQARERDLRNYHQEQQYNRSLLAEMASNKSDRSMSPSTLSEEGRRELIARQHRALYGNDGQPFLPSSGFGDDSVNRDPTVGGKGPVSTGGRGPSPRGMDPFGIPGQSGPATDASGQGVSPESSREKAASPAGQTSATFGSFEGPSQSAAKAPTPPLGEESSHARHLSKSTTVPLGGGMAPIGSRPTTQQAPGQSLNKRTTSPLPSSLSYGFNSGEQDNERSNSANSNPGGVKENSPKSAMGTWGTSGGVWGSNKIGATSVWG